MEIIVITDPSIIDQFLWNLGNKSALTQIGFWFGIVVLSWQALKWAAKNI